MAGFLKFGGHPFQLLGEGEKLLQAGVLAEKFARFFRVVVEISCANQFFEFLKALFLAGNQRAEIHKLL